jgi:hypothetical protein
MISKRDMLNVANVFHQYCMTAAADTQEHDLVSLPLSRDTSEVVQRATATYLQYIQSSYFACWKIAGESITHADTGSTVNAPILNYTTLSVISKWKNANKRKVDRTRDQENLSQRVRLQDKRFSVDMFVAARMKSAGGLWNRLLSIERTERQLKCEDSGGAPTGEGRGSVFQLMGISNVDVVVPQLLYLHTHIESLRTQEGTDGRSAPYVEVFGELLSPCGAPVPRRPNTFNSDTARRSVLPTTAGVELFAIQTIASNWKTQLDELIEVVMSANAGLAGRDAVDNMEMKIVQRIHLLTNTLKAGTVPFFPESAASFKKTNYDYLIQDSVSKCKMMLLQQQIPLPVEVQESPSSDCFFSSIEMFQAISIPPALMKNGIIMLNHCTNQLSECVDSRNQPFLASVSELAFNLSHTIYEMLLFMTLASLRALLSACRGSFVLADCALNSRRADNRACINRSLTRISQECIM